MGCDIGHCCLPRQQAHDLDQARMWLGGSYGT